MEEFISFDSYASIYDDTRRVSDNLLNKFSFELKKSLSQFNEINSILEIGCGSGRVTQALATDYNITGVDISRKMLNLAKDKALKHNWNFTGILCDARKIPLPDNSIDIPLTVHLLHLIKDWKSVVEEGIRIAKYPLFVNGSLQRNYDLIEPFKSYWKFVNDQDKDLLNNKRIGIQDENELSEFFIGKGYKILENHFEDKTEISKEFLINLVNTKPFSGQRRIPDDIHNEAINFLVANNYFLDEIIDVPEKGAIMVYYRK